MFENSFYITLVYNLLYLCLGQIDERVVASEHFGGFVKKATPTPWSEQDGEREPDEGEEGDDDDRRKTKKEVMSELIAKSKYYKVLLLLIL